MSTLHRIASLTAFVSAALIQSVAFAGGAQEYQCIIIEPWNTTYSLAISKVSGLNNLNQVTGCATTEPLGGPCSFIWTLEDGKVTIDLAGQINDNGVIVATNYLRWPDGTFQEMDGAMSGAADINNQNVVAGANGSVYTCLKHSNREATVWSPEGGTILMQQELGIPAADQAWAINNSNVVVGVRSSTGHCGDQKAFYYDLETDEYIDLHFELVNMTSGITHAVDVNDSGVVIGDGPITMGGSAFQWSIADGTTIIPDLPGTLAGYSIPSSINNAGTVVGQAIVNSDWNAWIWDEQNGIRNLNEVTAGIPADFAIVEVKRINNNGWIIGRGHYGAWSPERAVVLIPLQMPGDLNGDQQVDSEDRSMFCAAIGSSTGEPAYMDTADLNDDGVIDHIDLAMLNALLPPCDGDIVSSTTFQPPADGVTDGADLAYLLGAWASQPSCADFVSTKSFTPPPDGVVDGADLAFMLGAWGVCE